MCICLAYCLQIVSWSKLGLSNPDCCLTLGAAQTVSWTPWKWRVQINCDMWSPMYTHQSRRVTYSMLCYKYFLRFLTVFSLLYYAAQQLKSNKVRDETSCSEESVITKASLCCAKSSGKATSSLFQGFAFMYCLYQPFRTQSFETVKQC